MELGVRSRLIGEIQPGNLLAVTGHWAEAVVVTKHPGGTSTH